MASFYSRAETEKKKKKRRACVIAAGAAALGGLTACVALCAGVNTLNAAHMQALVIGVSTVSGWAVILLWLRGIAPLGARIRHAEGILRGEAQCCRGEMRREKDVFHIPHSIDVCRVRLTDGEEEISLHIAAEMAGKLPPDGTRVCLRTVNRFIAECEVEHE